MLADRLIRPDQPGAGACSSASIPRGNYRMLVPMNQNERWYVGQDERWEVYLQSSMGLAVLDWFILR